MAWLIDCDESRRAGPVVDDHLLAQHVGESRGDRPCEDVDVRSGRKAEHQPDRLHRPRCGGCSLDQARAGKREQAEHEATVTQRHGRSPGIFR